MGRWTSLAILIIASQANAQEKIISKQDISDELEMAKKTAELYDTRLPALLIKDGTRKCEYFQFRIECQDVAVPKQKLLKELHQLERSLPDDEGLRLLDAYVGGGFFKGKAIVRFAVHASPVPPAIPFAGYDGRKSEYFVALEKESDLEAKGQTIKESDRNPYIQKVVKISSDRNAAGFDSRFDKGMTVEEALDHHKAAGFNFFQTEYDDHFGLSFLALRRSSQVVGADIALLYWNEFYERSTKRDLAWGNDCTDCAIVTKTPLGPDASLLQYCRVQIAAGRRGAPENCIPVVYSLPTGVWLLSAFTFEYADGLGGVDSGYQLECKPLKTSTQPVAWNGLLPDIQEVMQQLDYVPVKSKADSVQKFVNEFGESKLFPEKKYEWTTVTSGVIYAPDKKETLSGFYVALNVNFSLRPEKDQSRYRPALVPEETDGLRRLATHFRSKYSCEVSRGG